MKSQAIFHEDDEARDASIDPEEPFDQESYVQEIYNSKVNMMVQEIVSQIQNVWDRLDND